MSCKGLDDMAEVVNRHAYWHKKLSRMKVKLDKVEDQRDSAQKETGQLRRDVEALRTRIERNSASLDEVSQLSKQQEQLYHRDKTLLEKQEADLFAETRQSQKLRSELEASTRKFLQWNSILESQDPKDTYLRHLVEDSSNFYLRRFQVLSEPEATRRLREVTDSLDALRERATFLAADIKKATERKRFLERELAKEIRSGKRKSKLEREVNRLERELYSELRRTSSGREDLEREVQLVQVQLHEMGVLDEYANDIELAKDAGGSATAGQFEKRCIDPDGTSKSGEHSLEDEEQPDP